MDVQLYVYDLSRGLARQFSGAFLGTQIDAVYHTSVVVGGVEHFFGRGIQQATPGSTHHGQPMEVIYLGTTHLDKDTIQDYLHSVRNVYTAESYDLFAKNCNNFSHDFAQFLVGKGIPEKITSLPRTVLDTPFGQMLKPQLDQAMRGITQAVPETPHTSDDAHLQAASKVTSNRSQRKGIVHEVSTNNQLDSLLAAASGSCALIFFTSQTCPPCKACYPVFDSLAHELGDQVTLIKVDVSKAFDIGSRYQVRATPTFITFLQGDKIEEWKGANPAELESKVRLLVQMAHLPHSHLSGNLPTLQKLYECPVLYSKVPPLEKLLLQLGDASSDAAISSLAQFVQKRFASESGGIVMVPDLIAISCAIKDWLPKLSPSKLFSLIDLLRIAAVDPRISSFLAEEEVSTSVFLSVLDHITGDQEFPYSAHITTVQTACNLFSSELYPAKLLGDQTLAEPLISLIAISLLDEKHATLRVSAASLAFNIASWNHRRRLQQQPDILKEASQIELAASLVEAISREQNAESLRGLILALGLLAYCAAENGELRGVLIALDAGQIVGAKTIDSDDDKGPGLIDQVKQVVS